MKLAIVLLGVVLALYTSVHGADDKDKEKKDKEKYGTIIGIDLGTTYSW